MASPEKRCLYEVLGLPRDCTADEIRSAYRKLALQRHPDKLIKSGISESEATASFQELVNAYEVLSDVRERAWYDSHRSQILFSNSNPNNSSSASAVVPYLFNFFSNSVFSGYSDKSKGFYKVYADVFDKIYRNELNFARKLGLGDVVKEAPLMGNLDSPYAQVTAFYGYWLGFVTVMDFVWADEYDAMAGPNRKSRRLMEEENKKIRKKAKREYNDTVRGLAEFVKKRDKRVIDMQMKRNEEMEKRKLEERMRKKEMEREKAERARAYEEPYWARLEDEVVEEEEEEEEGEEERKNELYCAVCGKKFKSDKQWKNHEQSKKHKEKLAELREAFREEDGENSGNEDNDDEVSGDGDGFVSVDKVDKLKNQFEGIGILEEKDYDEESQSTEEEEEIVDIENGGSGGLKGAVAELGLDGDDDETGVLEAMVSGHKSRKNVGSTRKPKASSKKVYVEVETEEVDLMEFNNKKGRRKRGGKKERAKRADEEEHHHQRVDEVEISSKAELDNKCDDGSQVEKPSSSQPFAENENIGQGDDEPPGKIKASMQAPDNGGQEDNKQPVKIKVSKQGPETKVINKKDVSTKAKNPSKGKRQKARSKNSGHECDTCGIDFESRNKLHKHLSDTGHAALKSR